MNKKEQDLLKEQYNNMISKLEKKKQNHADLMKISADLKEMERRVLGKVEINGQRLSQLEQKCLELEAKIKKN